ncbi:DUF4249 domain-containing protein [Pontibacter locisalis]|uniref:DUF4249 domain-containing protein n=1 Tax=Pontibacter locisalis TaxID=1719035 RepID=A0ABW5IN13_9BACT
MKLHKFLLAGLALIAVTLQGCEKDVANFDMSTTPMLVVTSFISPQDTALAVELRRTQPAIGKQSSYEELKVTDATVTISDGSQTVNLTYHTAHDKYFTSKNSLPVVAGKSYFLKVTTPSGDKAEAVCTVPLLTGIRVTELNYNVTPMVNYGYPMNLHKISFKWQDAPGVENYYHLVSYRTYKYTYGYPPVIETQHEAAYTDNSKIFIGDAKQDGNILHSPEFTITSGDPDHAPKPINVVAVLAVTDRAYYQYHQTVLSQENDGGNPFAEPRQIYSNVQGGLGVFAAYNQIKVQKTFY